MECRYRLWLRETETYHCARYTKEESFWCDDDTVTDCIFKEIGKMANWKTQAKKDSKGRFIKFDEEQPSHTLTFLAKVKDEDGVMVDSPNRVMKQSTQRKGEEYAVYDFGVEEDGEAKVMSVSQKSLLRQLIEEDDVEPLVGRTLLIKCLDTAKKTQWKIREVKVDRTAQENWTGEKDNDTEAETQQVKPRPKKETAESTEEKKDTVSKPLTKTPKKLWPPEEKEKEKFMTEVAKRTKKPKKDKEPSAEEMADIKDAEEGPTDE